MNIDEKKQKIKELVESVDSEKYIEYIYTLLMILAS